MTDRDLDVKPGDKVTAEAFNRLVAQCVGLQRRVEADEQRVQSLQREVQGVAQMRLELQRVSEAVLKLSQVVATLAADTPTPAEAIDTQSP